MQIDIDRLTEDELIQLNQRVVARIKILRSMHAHAEMLRFNVGQTVSFEPPGRDRQIGTLIRHNRKTVSVLTEDGQKWNVSPHLLSPVKDVTNKNSGTGRIIDITSRQ